MGFVAALLYALLMNGLPLVEVIVSGRSPGVLLLLYWFETVLLLVTGAIRIVLHRRATAKAGHYASSAVAQHKDADAASVRRQLEGENAYLTSFVGITVIFTIVHGLFVLLLVLLFRVGGPVSWNDVRVALTYAIAVQALFLLWDLPRLRNWSFADLQRNVGQTPLRVLVTQLGLILGFPVMGITGSAWGLIGTFVALRSLTDAGIVWLQGFVKRRDLPPGLARVLARTSKQSVEALEAEFDAMKRDGAEVEALLELTIDEARRGGAPR